jgi:hypothetical protein
MSSAFTAAGGTPGRALRARAEFVGRAILLAAVPFGLLLFLVEDR